MSEKSTFISLLDTHSPNVDLDFLENLNFHVLMFLKVYKHVFTRVRLCSSKKIHINITHIALMLIWILLDYRVNSAKNHVFRLPFQKGSTKYFHFHVFVFLQVLCIWIYPNLALFTPKIQIDTQTRGDVPKGSNFIDPLTLSSSNSLLHYFSIFRPLYNNQKYISK